MASDVKRVASEIGAGHHEMADFNQRMLKLEANVEALLKMNSDLLKMHSANEANVNQRMLKLEANVEAILKTNSELLKVVNTLAQAK